MKYSTGIRVILFTILFMFIGQAPISAEPIPTIELKDALLDEISIEGVQTYWEEIVDEYGQAIPDLEKTSFYEFIKDINSFSIKDILTQFLHYLFHELILNGKLLGSLLMLTLFAVILQSMQSAFEKTTVSRVAYFVIFLVLIFLVLNSFYLATSYTKEAIDTMKGFMIALLPLVLGMMASFGNVVSISFFHPIIIFLINFSGVFISVFVLPLLFLAAMLVIISGLNENYKVTHLANLFKSVALGTLGVFLTIFLGVISVQGTASAIQDGVAMKTAKFVTGNFIPVVGRTFTDAADTILSASLILKNALGIAGLVVILFIVAFPAIKVAAIALIYKIAAAVLQPIGGGPIVQALNTISTYILYILACLLAVSLMFLLAIVIIVAASNLTILLR
ncbi:MULTISPECIES: stage III sporulation protein AE [Oceanobacillus]|uniref:Stage III sporulation protein AE n=1 Tax=Oceanobacillus kimchii TaxID=746691 RepID=A0ABQ5TLT0_9BACI|nr:MULTISPECIES: stage III sporulation protein AE [Oceanobacillus]MBT2598358.1 stage III sporulation protein AE [Oceanobacillus sp. ISL-74]MBT2651276.1 stage III sporulation protein AE [Oceanobacillus sp. ISL-73]MCT1575935.1 stage III sporulation protein AE [Oceanobacillus kimchii]MCT2135572.1 stage III sporulation protein AE [Oceanobacillus kimchii]OEH55675.1 stage III sporulation protein AE [Oceanobacillus sp. E9]